MKFVPRNSVPQNSFPNTFRGIIGPPPEVGIGNSSSNSINGYPLAVLKRGLNVLNVLSRKATEAAADIQMLEIESLAPFSLDDIMRAEGEFWAVFEDFTLPGGSEIVGFEILFPPPNDSILAPSEFKLAVYFPNFGGVGDLTPVESNYDFEATTVVGSNSELFGLTNWPITATAAGDGRAFLVGFATENNENDGVLFDSNDPVRLRIYYV